ncbi:MAG: RluA family pseudouridine synthase [Lachnospiraceae bacterium]|nr:RluA family pseudouridine synthase [Lachnospiraceae bacterium]
MLFHLQHKKMKEFTVSKDQSSQRLEKYLKRILKDASTGFIYKMLRKKNITLNGKKAAGNESLSEGDVIKIFLSDDTFSKMAGQDDDRVLYERLKNTSFDHVNVLLENDEICVLNKPAGILSQSSDSVDLSLNEEYLAYLIHNGLSYDDFKMFHPSVANRLDRNTSGIILCGKTLQGQKTLSESIREKKCRKLYKALVHGKLKDDCHIKAAIRKDIINNISQVIPISDMKEGDSEIETIITPEAAYGAYSLLNIEILTGKSHQIRAQLKSMGLPMMGDPKYGDSMLDKALKIRPKRQMLHAYKIILPDGLTVEAPLPEDMKAYL